MISGGVRGSLACIQTTYTIDLQIHPLIMRACLSLTSIRTTNENHKESKDETQSEYFGYLAGNHELIMKTNIMKISYVTL